MPSGTDQGTEAVIEMTRTLFIVSSKSGTTTEPNALKDYFFARVAEAVGKDKAGGHCFRRVFLGQPNIGGRYSMLSPFGLVPAAAGINFARLLEAAQAMVRSCGGDLPPADNPAVQLGIALGVAGREGRDKVTLFSSTKLVDFGTWAEQLIAESTGKNGKGLIPIDTEPLGVPDLYCRDRFFIDLRTRGRRRARRLGEGRPPGRAHRAQVPEYIGQEFFRFELAIAVAGAVNGINPFDQPDVEASKAKTRELTATFEKMGALPGETPVAREGVIEVYTDAANAEALKKAGADGGIDSWLKAHFARLIAAITRPAVFFLRSPRMRPLISRFQGMARASASPRPVQARGDFDMLAERGRRGLAGPSQRRRGGRTASARRHF
jgi:transaldolase / glucose-6-phosphate isomerase